MTGLRDSVHSTELLALLIGLPATIQLRSGRAACPCPTKCSASSMQKLPLDCCGSWCCHRLVNGPWSEVQAALHLLKPSRQCAWAWGGCKVCNVDLMKMPADQHLSQATPVWKHLGWQWE